MTLGEPRVQTFGDVASDRSFAYGCRTSVLFDKDVAVPEVETPTIPPWFVYILRCADDSLYTGINKNLERRLQQHLSGTASRYTRSRLPVAVEYHEEQPNQSTALKRELVIKALSRQSKEFLIRSSKHEAIIL